MPLAHWPLRSCAPWGDGIHEDLDVTNHNLSTVTFNLEIALRSDFADLFEVKAHKFVRRGHIMTEWNEQDGELQTSYTFRDFHRLFAYRLLNCTSPPHYANGRITFEIELAPGATWHACCYYILSESGRLHVPIHGCYHDVDRSQLTDEDHLQEQWLRSVATLISTNEEVYRFYRQSVEDLGALPCMESMLARHEWHYGSGERANGHGGRYSISRVTSRWSNSPSKPQHACRDNSFSCPRR